MDEKIKNSILKALADPIDKNIIQTISNESKSVNDINSIINLSKSSTYRRLKNLKEEGVVYIQRILENENGNPTNQYRATFSHIDIKFNGEEITIDAEPTSKVIEQTYKLFSGLRR